MNHSLSTNEYNRRFRVLDQMLSGHALLRERYESRAFAVMVALLVLSIIGTSIAFLAGDIQVSVGGYSSHLQTWVGIITALIFFLTLIDLLANWRQQAGAHAEAARRLGELKALYRAAVTEGDQVTSESDLALEYDRIVALIPPIPESLFLYVKAKHLRKVEMSRLLDEYPGAPLIYIRWLAPTQRRRRPS